MNDLIECRMTKEASARIFKELEQDDTFTIIKRPPEGTPKEWLDLFEFREIEALSTPSR